MPLVMNVLAPLTTKWSPSRMALVDIDARSDPMPGSVIAIAVTSSPLHTPGSQRARCSSVVSDRRYGRQMSLCSEMPRPGRAHARCLPGLGEHLVVAEVVDAAAAVLLGRCHREEPGCAGLGEQLVGHDARGVPLRAERRHLALDERRDARSEQLVVGGEVRPSHRGLTDNPTCRQHQPLGVRTSAFTWFATRISPRPRYAPALAAIFERS